MILYSKLKGGNSGISILLNVGYYYIYDKHKCSTKGIFCICAKKKKKSKLSPQKYTAEKKSLGSLLNQKGLGNALGLSQTILAKKFEAELHEFIVIRQKLVVFKIQESSRPTPMAPVTSLGISNITFSRWTHRSQKSNHYLKIKINQLTEAHRWGSKRYKAQSFQLSSPK